MDNSNVLWSLDRVSVNAGAAYRLDGITLLIRPGVTAVLGASGAGKSSLLNLLVDYERPDAGTVAAHIPNGGPSVPLYWVPQNHGLWPHLTAGEHLEKASPAGRPVDTVQSLLSSFDIADKAGRYPDELSQGERARLAVARALVTGASVLVMDEPLLSVDRARAGRYWAAIREHMAHTGSSLVFATHSPETVLAEARHVICLAEGKLLYDGEVRKLYADPPTPELAECLGEGNWLEPPEAELWLNDTQEKPCCYRPEQISIQPSDDGPVVVKSSRFKGSVAELDLEHASTGNARRFFCRPAGDVLRAGQRVALKALLSLVFVVLTGCGGTPDPAIPVTEFVSRSLPPDGPSLPAPRGISITRDGRVVTVDTAGRVTVFDPDGKVEKQWRMPESKIGTPEDVAVLRNGTILVPDTHYYRVIIFSPKGEILRIFGKKGTGPGEFLFPVSACEDDDGGIYVCEYGSNDRVQKFTRNGEFISSFGAFGTGPGEFQRPAGILWHEGKIYVADSTNHRIQVFSDAGEFERILGGTGNPIELKFPYDIAMGDDNVVYAAEWGAERVTAIGLDGTLLGRYARPPGSRDSLRTPWGIAFHPKRIIVVADTGNRRIAELRL